MKAPRLCAPALISLVLITPVSAQTEWGHSFRISGSTLPPLQDGILIPFRITDFNNESLGYALDGVSSRPDPGDPGSEFDVGYLARFDNNGLPLWSLALDPGASSISLDLFAVPEDFSRFFATYDEPTNLAQKAFRLGLFQGSDGSAVFAKRFATGASTPHYVEYFTGDQMGVTLDQGNTLETVVFDDTGAPIFNKAYSSPLFSPSTPPLLVQTLVRDLLPDRSGYLTAVAQTSLDFDLMGNISNEVKLIPFFTGLDGDVTSSNSYTFTTFSPGTIPFPSVLADNSVLYRIPALFNGVTVGGTPVPVTHLVKVNANGTLGWAKTVNSSQIFTIFPSPDALYLGGSRSDSSGPGQRNAVVLKIDPDNGDLLEQAAFSEIEPFDSAASISSNGSEVFVQLFSTGLPDGNPGEASSTSTLVKLDENLQILNSRQYQGELSVASLTPDDPVNAIARFLFNAHHPGDGSVRTFTLNDQLDSVVGCDLFAPFPLTLEQGVSIEDLAVAVAPANVTASDTTTPYADSTITFTPFNLELRDLCSLTPGLTISPGSNRNEILLSFPTEEGITYEVQFSQNLDSPFTPVTTVAGSGSQASVTQPIGSDRGFYRVSPAPPEN